MPDPAPDAADDPRRLRAQLGLYRSEGRRVWIDASGWSMKPLIRPGDQLLVDFAAQDVEIGEIALFPLGERIAAHRVIRRARSETGDLIVARGDGNVHTDPRIPLSSLLGVVRAHRRTAGGPAGMVACSGRRAVLLAGLSSAFGVVGDATDRLPPSLRRPALKLLRMVGVRGFGLLARVIALSERPGTEPVDGSEA